MATENSKDGSPVDPDREDDPSEYRSSRGVPTLARVGIVLASLVVTAAVLVYAIAE